MLVLTRKRNQEIVIGDSIRVVVTDIYADKVRIGITAPEDVPICRRDEHGQVEGYRRRENEGGR